MMNLISEFILTRFHSRLHFRGKTLNKFIKKIWLSIYFVVLERSEYFPTKTIERMQKKRLMTIISQAKKTVPFYAGRLGGINTFEDFLSLKPLSKTDLLKADGDSLINRNLESYKVIRSTSGGSTGVMFPFFHDSNMYIRRVALYHRMLRWMGIQKGDIVVWIMREPHPEFGGVPFVCFGTEDIEKRKDELYKLFRSKTVILHAMTSHLIFLADLLERDSEKFHFRGLISYAEPLHFEIRQHLTERFGAPVFDAYGTQEILIQGQDCEIHDGFHVNTEWVYIEVLDDKGKPLPAGKLGSVVMTSFDNEVMPFIRYRVGDVGYWAVGKCPCGRNLPKIKIAGRDLTFFIHPRGHIGDFISIVAPILKCIPRVTGFQIVRQSRFEFLVRIVPSLGFDNTIRDYIYSKILDYLGSDTRIKIEEIEFVPLGPGGKPRVFINMQDDLSHFINRIAQK